MTGQADFTEEEWTTILEGPTSAGMHVIVSDRGGTARETFSMAKAYTEARKQAGQSELLDTIVSSKPKVDNERAATPEELGANQLQKIRDAVALVEQKASASELEAYKGFVVGLAERVAERTKEGFLAMSGERVTDEERTAVNEVAEALGTDPPAPDPAA
jgi:hypothetical protein